jgi:rod shape determining protein RodA
MVVIRRLRIALGDPWLVGGVFLLTAFGVAMIYSAGQLDVPDPGVVHIWRMQLLWWVISTAALVLVLRIQVRWFEWAAVPLYTLAIVLLVAVLFIGVGHGTARGTRQWIPLGPVSFQPSQFANLATILLLGRVMGAWREAPGSVFQLWKPVGIVALPMLLVLAEPDLGVAIIFGATLIATLYWAGTPLGIMFMLLSPILALILAFQGWLFSAYMVTLIVFLYFYKSYLMEASVVVVANLMAGTVALPLWNHLKPYQKARLTIFLDPSQDPRGSGYHVIQSKVAIGSGGLFGKGFTMGTQKRLAFLPEQHTDFIFSVVGEEFGFLGTMLVILLFGMVLYRLARIAERVPDPFAGIVVFGIFGAWFAHVVENIGMTVGVTPVTGIPLPFISYGGSFLLATYIALGVAERIATEQGKI